MKAPVGICVVLPNDDPNISAQPCWTDPHVKGVCLRSTWGARNPAQGTFDWTYFVTGMELARANNKWIQMQVNGSLSDVPAWVYALGAKSFPLTQSKGTSTPAPWDPVLQAQWQAFVSAWATKYDHDPVLRGVTMWAGGKAIECYFCDNPTDASALDALGGPSLWLSGAQALVGAFSAFTETQPSLAVGNVYPDGNATMTTLAQWVPSSYCIQSNALSANFPGGVTFPHTTWALNDIPNDVGYQLLQPCKALGESLASVLNNALANWANWVQIYPGDPSSDPSAESAMAYFNTHVGA